MSEAEELLARLARSHTSVLAGLQKRLAMAEARLQSKEDDARTHPSDLKRERLYVAEALSDQREVLDYA